MFGQNRIGAATLAALLATTPLLAQQKIALPEKDQPLALNARTVFRVGAVEGEDYETFAGVNDLAFDAKGNLFVLDAAAYRVLVFDANGNFVRSIGRQGGGPGEFGFPSALALLATGELVVNDASKGSLQIFSAATGEFLRTAVVDEELGRAVGRMRVSPRGGVITETMQMNRLNGERRVAERVQLPPRSVSWLTIGETATGRRLYNAAPRQLKLSTPQRAEGGAMRVAMSVSAFEPSLLWAPTAEGGVAASNTASYRITISDDRGRPLRYLERPIEPRPVTDEDRKRWLENRRESAGGGGAGMVVAFATGSGASGAAPSRAPGGTMRVTGADVKEADVTWGEVIPVLTALGVDSFGRIWAQRSTEDLREGPIDLIGANGQYLGTLPNQPMPRAFGPDGRIAYIERDDLDVQRVVVKQLSR